MEAAKINSFLQAYATFQEVLKEPFESNAIVRDASIQCFEYTVDAGWKALKEVLQEKFGIEVASPITVFREAFAQNLISKNDRWIDMVKARNATSHIYSEQNAIKIVSFFKEYEALLGELATTLKTYATKT